MTTSSALPYGNQNCDRDRPAGSSRVILNLGHLREHDVAPDRVPLSAEELARADSESPGHTPPLGLLNGQAACRWKDGFALEMTIESIVI
jgi:hypothetical protein